MLSDDVRRIVYKSLQTNSFPESRYSILNKIYWEPKGASDLDKRVCSLICPSQSWNSEFLVIDRKPILNKDEPRLTCVNVIYGSAGEKDKETGHFKGRFDLTSGMLRNMLDDRMLYSNCLVGKYGVIEHASSVIVFICSLGSGKGRKIAVSSPQNLRKLVKVNNKDYSSTLVATHFKETGKDMRKLEKGWYELAYLPKFANEPCPIEPFIWNDKEEPVLSLWCTLKHPADTTLSSFHYPSGWLTIPQWKDEVATIDSKFNRSVGIATDDEQTHKALVNITRTQKDIGVVYDTLIRGLDPLVQDDKIIEACVKEFPAYSLFPKYSWPQDNPLYYSKKEMVHCSQPKNE